MTKTKLSLAQHDSLEKDLELVIEKLQDITLLLPVHLNVNSRPVAFSRSALNKVQQLVSALEQEKQRVYPVSSESSSISSNTSN